MYDEAWKASLTFSRTKDTDLPLSDVLHPLSKGSLQASTELQGVAADLDDVVDKSTHGRQGKRRGEEHHIAKLNEHFLVILKRVLFGVKRNETIFVFSWAHCWKIGSRWFLLLWCNIVKRRMRPTSYVCIQLSISAWVRVTVLGSSGGSIHDFLSSFPSPTFFRLWQSESDSFAEDTVPFSLDSC